METAAPLRVYFVRHGRVASHRGDIPLTEEGLREVEEAGRRFIEQCGERELVELLHAPTRRTYETALTLQRSMLAEARTKGLAQMTIQPPIEHMAIRNPDLYIGGSRVEMVSSAEALVEQLPVTSGIGLQQIAEHPFMRAFWNAPERIGYWVSHADPPGEDAHSVARRLFTFAASLPDLPRERPQLYLCITHSGPMRALLLHYLLGYDPGEPDYAEAIALEFDDGRCSIRWREHMKTLRLSGR